MFTQGVAPGVKNIYSLGALGRFGVIELEAGFRKSSRARFCFEERFAGTSISTRTWRSPQPPFRLGMPLPRSRKILPLGGAGRELDAGVAVRCGDIDVTSQSRARGRDVHDAGEIIILALEDFMRAHMQDNIEVSCGPAAHAALAFAGETQARTGLHSFRDAQSDMPRVFDAAGTAAFLTGFTYDRALAAADRSKSGASG